MTRGNLKPPATAGNIQKIARGILGKTRKVISVTSLTPERDQRAFLYKFGDIKPLVVKYAKKSEWQNQKIASGLGISTPKTIGNFLVVESKRDKTKSGRAALSKGWFGQQYIQNAETLASLLQKDNGSRSKMFSAAISLLVDIHGLLGVFRKKKHSLPVLTRKALKEQFNERINYRLLPLFKKLEGVGKYKKHLKKWKETILAFDRESAAATLGRENNIPVLVRWDYKPDNILVRKDGQGVALFSIDWSVLAVGSSWIDLGFLLAGLNEKQRERYVKKYLELQKNKRPGWRRISLEMGKKRVNTACAFIELIHASSNAKFILENKAKSYTYARLRDHMNKLAGVS